MTESPKRRKTRPAVGRPTKALDDNLRDQILNLIRLGVPQEVAARRFNLAPSTLFRWLKQGRDALDALDVDYPTAAQITDPVKRIYAEFSEAVDAARAEAEVDMTLLVRRAAVTDVKAAMWWLDRAHPERWAQRQTTRLEGADGGDVTIKIEWPGDKPEKERSE